MKRGTIVQPSYKSYLVYLGTQGEYANCLWLINGKFPINSTTIERFYKSDILKDRENFPIVGYVNIDKVIHDAILAGVKEQEHGTGDKSNL